jgi:two-component system sensor histidine kinase/response regulator
MKILVIDDQAEIRDTLEDILKINGHEVITAEDGVQGVEAAGKQPDFIFCDVSMPNLDGHGVLAAIKAMPAICEVPFVFLTANSTREEQRAGMALGADDYITKPFGERDILDAIAARTKRQGGLRDRITALAERHQREINAHWSHELLTPLNAVMGCLDLLELDTDNISREELKEMLALIREGAERQERLARKLIRYFSLEQMRQAPPSATRARCSVAAAINAGAEKAAQEKNCGETLSVCTVAGEVALHEELLRDAIYEVVANAMTFSPAGSSVKVVGAIRDGWHQIEINDQGPGLTAEQRAQVGAFAQFERQKREHQGLGLGLAIAQMTARLAGGDLILDAGPGGRGLRVIFTLPSAGASS